MNIKPNLRIYIIFSVLILFISKSMFSAAKIESETLGFYKYYDLGSRLIKAVNNCDVCSVQKIITAGADVNFVDSDQMTPLIYACKSYMSNNDTGTAKILLENGANVNYKIGPTKITPLMYAIAYKTENVSTILIELLIESGADINSKSVNGGTSLMIAVQQGSEDVVELLLQAGADLEPTLDTGEKAIDLAKYNPHFLVKETRVINLLKKEPERRKKVINSLNERKSKIVNKFIPKAMLPFTGLIAEYFACESYGNLPSFYRLDSNKILLNAVKNNDKTTVEMLLGENLDLNIKLDQWGYSFLHFAIAERFQDIAKLLLDSGADINFNSDIEDGKGWTPLMLAVYDGNKEMVRFLLDMGADLNKVGISGKNIRRETIVTALDLAQNSNKNKDEISKMLLEEPSRRTEAVKKFNEDLVKKISESDRAFIPVISKVIAQYIVASKYEDIPKKYK